MTYLNTQIKRHPLADCTQTNSERVVMFPIAGHYDDSKRDDSKHDCPSNRFLTCFLKGVRVGPKIRLSSRVSYTLPKAVPATAADALNYADDVNEQLQHSQVFVVKDIDGDGHHYLRMDTVLQITYERKNISSFLDCITEDINILLKYFNYRPPSSVAMHVTNDI